MNNQKDIVQQWKEAEDNNWLKAWIITKCVLMLAVGTLLFFIITSAKFLLIVAGIAFFAGNTK